MKNKNCCYPHCENCPFSDCTVDKVYEEEIQKQNKFDEEILFKRRYGKGVSNWIYEHSEKGKNRAKKYSKSQKGKEAHDRYIKSEKGKITRKKAQRKQTEKRILSGKNAESCRRYYQKKKMEKLLLSS